MGRFYLRLGALSPTLQDQLEVQGLKLDSDKRRHFQKDMDALVRLKVRGVLSSGEADRAGKRLTGMIGKVVKV